MTALTAPENAGLIPFANVEMTFFPDSKNHETVPVTVFLTAVMPFEKAVFTTLPGLRWEKIPYTCLKRWRWR